MNFVLPCYRTLGDVAPCVTGGRELLSDAHEVHMAPMLFDDCRESLVAHRRAILAQQCRSRARELATRMTKPVKSVVTSADLWKFCSSMPHCLIGEGWVCRK